jgi:ferredoxin
MVKVAWDEDICISSGDCCSLLPSVFKFEDDKLVIDTSGASEEAIRDAVARCPSGALSIEER